MNSKRWTIAILASALTWACREPAAGPDSAFAPISAAESNWDGQILSVDHFVPHISTVAANQGEAVRLFVHERVRDNARDDDPVVLFIHGGSVPSVPAFDLSVEHYSWAAWLAQSGFDVFMMDLTGYGQSPRPKMDDPCNVDPAQQNLLVPNPLAAPCPVNYPFRLTNRQDEWNEIDAVVDYIRHLRRVDRISLAGWSGGGNRFGPYVVQHPEKVERLFLYSPNYAPTGPSNPPPVLPEPGFPMTLQTRPVLFGQRWDPEVKCADQIEEGVRDAVWEAIMDQDAIGRTWGPPEGVMRVRTLAGGPLSWGWNKTTAGRVDVPTLIIAGEDDRIYAQGAALYADLGTPHKVFVTVQCASHHMVWERQHKVLHHVSKDWLKDGNLDGYEQGEFYVDTEGVIHKQ